MVFWVLLGGLAACGASADNAGSTSGGNGSYKADAGARSAGTGGATGFGIPANNSGGTSGTITTTSAPPEQETKVDFMTPQGGKQRVYIANPTRNTVTIIDANGPTNAPIIHEQSSGGETPTYVATLPGQDVALVINVGSHTLAVLRNDDAPKSTYPIVSKANAIAVAADGQHAVVWFDSSQANASATSATGAAGSTQEVSVVALGGSGGDAVVSMSVGYNPSAVVFSSDSSAAFVVTDDGISELRFAEITGPGIAPFTRIDDGSLTLAAPDASAPTPALQPDAAVAPAVGLDAGALPDLAPVDADETLDGGIALDGSTPDAQASKPDLGKDTIGADAAVAKDSASAASITGKPVDVSVTRAGDYAIARRDGSAAVLLVDLKAKTVSTLVLSSEVTDLDLVDNAAGAQAFAVLRSESTLVRIDIPAGFTDQSHRKSWPFSGSMIGSVTISANGTYALLYTTAIASMDLAVFDLITEKLLPAPALHKTIRAVAIAPDEKTALVLHNKAASTGSSTTLTQQQIDDQSYGYTMVDLRSSLAKLIITPADPKQFVITPDSSNAFVVLRDDQASIRTVQRMSLVSFVERDFPLGSPPSSVAALSADIKKVFVGQVYTEGRISFINWETDGVQTVTGFALSGRIQQ